MEGCYKVEENINFESFLRVMGVTEEEQIQRMMAATKEVIVIIILSSSSSSLSSLSSYYHHYHYQVTLTNNGDGTWTQVSGLKTSTFPIGQEYTVRLLVLVLTSDNLCP